MFHKMSGKIVICNTQNLTLMWSKQ